MPPEPIRHGSRSRCTTQTVNGSHHFTINGYSLSKGMGVGKFISSEPFDVGGHRWAIYFYPDGKNAEDNAFFVSVFIALASDGTDVRALFELTLLDQSGKDKHKVHSHFDRSLESGPYTLKYRGSMWGYKRFYRRATLETSDYFKDDSLSITCKVGVVVSSLESLRQQTLALPETQIGRDLGDLLDSGEGADVAFEVEEEIFHVHKLILAARSPVFKAQLFGPMRDETTSVFKIEDMKAEVFKAMLHFIYSDSFPTTYDDQSGAASSSSSAASTMMSQHLLAAADRYGLDRLRIYCESKLCENVSVDTVATTLALAEQHHASHLKRACLSFAVSNLAAVIETDGFEYLRESCPSLQGELLRALAGMGGSKELRDAGKYKGVWAHLTDGTDGTGRRTRPRRSTALGEVQLVAEEQRRP